LINEYWVEIEKKYSTKNRYYHTLQHLENLLLELNLVKDKIEHWNVVLFSLFYHDIVYNCFKTNNEEKSASLVVKRLQQLEVSAQDHDIVYNCFKTNNEEKSASLVVKRLQQLEVSAQDIGWCVQHILATKNHQISSNNDVNFFTDADLSVLGKSWNIYEDYFICVRKEYIIYPAFIYNKGRKKVLQHFLNMKKIYKTDFFFDTYEKQARINL
jgi:predicted metal-dependent HD superfamily phosphohydrolase